MLGLDLFSGIGGLTKALEGYVHPVAYCENDRYAQGVLLSRMRSSDIPLAPVATDVCELHGDDFADTVEIIYGGFPCQDISIAGRGEGLEGKRSGLFFEIVRLVGEIRPRFVFLENVPVITCRGGGRVVSELTALGYDSRWGVLSAADVGANHLRERWWLLAYSRHGSGRDIGTSERRQNSSQEWSCNHDAVSGSGKQSSNVADSASQSGDGYAFVPKASHSKPGKPSKAISDASGESIARTAKRRSGGQKQDPLRTDWWQSEPHVGRVAHGVPFRVDRLRGLGNAVVPAQAREAFERLMGLK